MILRLRAKSISSFKALTQSAFSFASLAQNGKDSDYPVITNVALPLYFLPSSIYTPFISASTIISVGSSSLYILGFLYVIACVLVTTSHLSFHCLICLLCLYTHPSLTMSIYLTIGISFPPMLLASSSSACCLYPVCCFYTI